MNELRDKQIDAGAEALRQRLQGGKRLRPWSELPNSTKRKWRDYSAVVLCAAASITPLFVHRRQPMTDDLLRPSQYPWLATEAEMTGKATIPVIK